MTTKEHTQTTIENNVTQGVDKEEHEGENNEHEGTSKRQQGRQLRNTLQKKRKNNG